MQDMGDGQTVARARDARAHRSLTEWQVTAGCAAAADTAAPRVVKAQAARDQRTPRKRPADTGDVRGAADQAAIVVDIELADQAGGHVEVICNRRGDGERNRVLGAQGFGPTVTECAAVGRSGGSVAYSELRSGCGLRLHAALPVIAGITAGTNLARARVVEQHRRRQGLRAERRRTRARTRPTAPECWTEWKAYAW